MIIKGYVTKRDCEGRTHIVGDTIDIPDAALNDIIDARLMLYGLTRPKGDNPPPEERSCETCLHEKTPVRKNPCYTCNQPGEDCWEPKQPAPAPEDALAMTNAGQLFKDVRAERRFPNLIEWQMLYNYCNSAIAKEQARTKAAIKILEDHGPDGHNCTNQQFVDLRRRLEEAEARIGCAEADRNHEIELREEAERKLAEAWTDEDMRHASRVGWNYNDHRRDYMEMKEEFNLWLSALRKERKG